MNRFIFVIFLTASSVLFAAEPSRDETIAFINEKLKLAETPNNTSVAKFSSKNNCELIIPGERFSPFDLSKINLSQLAKVEAVDRYKSSQYWNSEMPQDIKYPVNIQIGKQQTTIFFYELDPAQRFSKALYYLASKCGAKEELF